MPDVDLGKLLRRKGLHQVLSAEWRKTVLATLGTVRARAARFGDWYNGWYFDRGFRGVTRAEDEVRSPDLRRGWAGEPSTRSDQVEYGYLELTANTYVLGARPQPRPMLPGLGAVPRNDDEPP